MKATHIVAGSAPAIQLIPRIDIAAWVSQLPELRETAAADEYVGTADQLIRAGLVAPGQFPGDPGRGRIMATYLEYGTPVRQGNTESRWRRTVQIRRATNGRFSVAIRLSAKEREIREADDERERLASPLNLRVDGKTIFVEVRGSINATTYARFINAIADHASKHGSRSVIMDLTCAEDCLSIKQWAALILCRRLRRQVGAFGLLVPEPLLNRATLVAFNGACRGICSFAFVDLGKASEWGNRQRIYPGRWVR